VPRNVTRRGWLAAGAAVTALTALAAGCDWFDDPVEANLLPDTTMESCPAPGELLAGEDAAVAWSGSDPDGAVVKYAWVLDDTLSGETMDAELVIQAVTEGDHVLEVAAVDDDGDLDPTPAVCSFTAGAPGGLVPRVVLAEFLTTRPCPNCPNAEGGLNIVLDEYGADSLCVIAYHDLQPPADPFATAETVARIDWYMGGSWNSWPLVLFDGGHSVLGAVSPEVAAAAYRTEIDYRRSIWSPLSMRIAGGPAAGSVTVTVKVREALTTTANVLRVVVIENNVIASAQEYDFVARDLLDDEPLSVAAVGDSAVVTRTLTLGPTWNVDNLDVIAFVQDDLTKEVLQSIRSGAR
jgi:hypothetical protein